jgi:predicted O-methyltransferase YrrM
VDTLDRCYFDDRYQTGEAAAVMYPDGAQPLGPAARQRRLALRKELPAGSMDLAFIDALHVHPWPFIDLLQVTELMKPGAWIVLHDIELPNVSPECTERGRVEPVRTLAGQQDSRRRRVVQLRRRADAR